MIVCMLRLAHIAARVFSQIFRDLEGFDRRTGGLGCGNAYHGIKEEAHPLSSRIFNAATNTRTSMHESTACRKQPRLQLQEWRCEAHAN